MPLAPAQWAIARRRRAGLQGSAVLVAALLIKLLPIYVLVALGWVAGRVLQVKTQEIGRILLFFLSPAVIFKGFSSVDLSSPIILLPLAIFAVAVAISFAAAGLAGRLWQDGRERIAAFSAATGNTGYFGIPAGLTLIGPEALPVVVMVTFGAVLYEVSVGYYLVMRSNASVPDALRRVLAYPGLHAAWIGLLVNAFGVPLPLVVTETVGILTGAYSPLGMMIVGIGLASLIKGSFDLAFMSFTFLAKFVLWPGLAFAFVLLDQAALHLFDPLTHKVLIIESLVPMAAITVVHATLQDISPEKASLAVGFSTVFALLYIPLVLTLVF